MFQLKWIWRNLKGRQAAFVTGIVLSVLTSAFVIINPRISQTVVDEIIVGTKTAAGTVDHHLDLLLPLLALMVGVQLAISSLRYGMIVLFEKSSQHLLIGVRQKLYDNLQRQDMRFYHTYRTGDLMTRLTGDLDMLRHFCSWIVYNVTDSVVLFLVTIVYFFTISWQLTLMLVGMTPLIFAVSYIFSKKIRPVFISLREKLSQMNTAAQENISGNRVVKAFNREKYEVDKFTKKNEEYRRNNLQASYTWLKFYPVLEFLAQSLTLITILCGGLLIMRGQMTYGKLMAFSALTWAIANPMRMLGQILNDTQRFFASANKIIELYYAKPRIAGPEHPVERTPARGAVEFRDVSFGYGNETVFDHISVSIRPGQTIGIMGPTGSGKSTFASLIGRFEDVTGGSVRVDGVDVRQYDLRRLRRAIGMATQDVFLFSDTIDGNIAYGSPDLPEEAVRRCAALSDADGFIQETSEGYYTIIGERGVGLSGGQRQRLALARALAVKPSILILDDTTSAVDMETEKLIQHNLERLDFPCTKIIIAQRVTSVRSADRILILGDHRIAAQGTHEELMRRRGYYYEICRLQQEGIRENAADGCPAAGGADRKRTGAYAAQ